jgi:hypothetical protein
MLLLFPIRVGSVGLVQLHRLNFDEALSLSMEAHIQTPIFGKNLP